jgi:hypothetical protein
MIKTAWVLKSLVFSSTVDESPEHEFTSFSFPCDEDGHSEAFFTDPLN